MLYINSFSTIEQEMFGYIVNSKKSAIQINANHILDIDFLDRQHFIKPNETLLYSFLDYSKYDYLTSFQHEVKNIELIIEFAQKNKLKNIILLSYPGSYENSDNLYLQHKGVIENKIANANIPFTILSVQSIISYENRCNTLQNLFYNQHDEKFIIPKKSSQIIYSIDIKNLVEIILKVSPTAYNNSYDIMDSVYDLREYMSLFNTSEKIERILPMYLHFRSYMGNFISPTMLDLFLRPTIPMYKSRAKKEFEIDLEQKEFKVQQENYINQIKYYINDTQFTLARY